MMAAGNSAGNPPSTSRRGPSPAADSAIVIRWLDVAESLRDSIVSSTPDMTVTMSRSEPRRKTGQLMDAAMPDTRNALLHQLSNAEYERVRSHLKDVTLEFKQVLYEPDGPVDAAYFVEQGVVSLVTLLDDGATVETGTVGNEGVAGLPVFHDSERRNERAICTIGERD